MKKTMYELLGMIKDGKAPKKIKYNDKIYYAKGNAIEGFVDYCSDEDEWCFNHYVRYENLNKEVEILEESKGIPEKLYHCCMETDNEETKFLIKNMNDLVDRYNEIFDYLESKGE